uniref:Uncharacterized protein n=1 Tax=Trichogramma kaykai TaxID=54128 RepID=A0ABD2W7L5_9HYME
MESRCCASAMTIGWSSRLQQQGSSSLVLQLLHAQRFELRGSSAAKKQQQLCKNYTRAQVSRGKAVFACKRELHAAAASRTRRVATIMQHIRTVDACGCWRRAFNFFCRLRRREARASR